MHPWIDIWYRNWVPKKLRVPIFNMWGISKLNLNSLLRNKLKEQLYSPRLGEHISAISTHCTALHSAPRGWWPGAVCGLITRWQEHSSGPPPWPVCLQCVPILPRCVPTLIQLFPVCAGNDQRPRTDRRSAMCQQTLLHVPTRSPTYHHRDSLLLRYSIILHQAYW